MIHHRIDQKLMWAIINYHSECEKTTIDDEEIQLLTDPNSYFSSQSLYVKCYVYVFMRLRINE